MRDVLTVQEVADRLRLNRNFVYTLLNTGQLAGVRTGARWRIPRQAVDEFLGVRARTSMSGRALRADEV